MNVKDMPIPEAWPALVRSAVLHTISLARWAMLCIHSQDSCHENPDVRAASDMQQREDEIALLREQIRILKARLVRIPPKHRPFYPPCERMAILSLKTARGWNLGQTANAFSVTAETVSNWLMELDQEGPNRNISPVQNAVDARHREAQLYKHTASLS